MKTTTSTNRIPPYHNAAQWSRAMHALGLGYHIDDDPSDLVGVLFSPEELATIKAILAGMTAEDREAYFEAAIALGHNAHAVAPHGWRPNLPAWLLALMTYFPKVEAIGTGGNCDFPGRMINNPAGREFQVTVMDARREFPGESPEDMSHPCDVMVYDDERDQWVTFTFPHIDAALLFVSAMDADSVSFGGR